MGDIEQKIGVWAEVLGSESGVTHNLSSDLLYDPCRLSNWLLDAEFDSALIGNISYTLVTRSLSSSNDTSPSTSVK